VERLPLHWWCSERKFVNIVLFLRIGETSEIFKEVEPLNGKLKKLEVAHERHAKV